MKEFKRRQVLRFFIVVTSQYTLEDDLIAGSKLILAQNTYLSRMAFPVFKSTFPFFFLIFDDLERKTSVVLSENLFTNAHLFIIFCTFPVLVDKVTKKIFRYL